MAREDYTGVPTVAASEQAPDDYQRIDATPASFGAAANQGAEALSQGALDVSKFYGQVAADNATNNFLKQATDLLHGDPNKTVPGPDGQPMPDTGYFGKRGADAMAARQQTAEQLDEAIAAQREALSTPQARLQFDTESRRYRAQYAAQMNEYADTQQRVWAQDTNRTSAELALNVIARNPADPFATADAQDRVRNAYVKNAQLQFGDSEEIKQGALLKADQDIAKKRIDALIVQDPQAAEKAYQGASGVLGSLPEYGELGRQIKTAVVQSEFSPAVDAAVQKVQAEAQPRVGIPGSAPEPEALHAAFLGQESGNNSNIGVSKAGAHGPGQIMPDTFAQFARPGESIDNPADNRAVSARMLDHYNQVYNGDAARVAVAYFSGPGNVAPAGSPTPWINDRTDPNGKSVSSYVADIQSRLAKFPSTADALQATIPQAADDARKYAETKWPQYPDVQERYVQTVTNRLEQAAVQQHRMYEADSHTVQAVMSGPNPPLSEDELMARSPEVAKAWSNMQVQNPYGAMSIERMFDANARGAASVYGTGVKDYLDRVLAPTGDPNRITNPSGLWPYVGKGNNSPLTNTGVNALTDLMSLRGSPQGEAFAQQARTFFQQMHGDLTFSNAGTGIVDKHGEAIFSQFVAHALPALETAYKGGTLAKVLDPKSPDYLGNAAQSLARTPAQMVKDRLEYDNPVKGLEHTPLAGPVYTVQSLKGLMDSLENDRQRSEALQDAVKSKRLSPDVYKAYLSSLAPQPGTFPDIPRPTINLPQEAGEP